MLFRKFNFVGKLFFYRRFKFWVNRRFILENFSFQRKIEIFENLSFRKKFFLSKNYNFSKKY